MPKISLVAKIRSQMFLFVPAEPGLIANCYGKGHSELKSDFINKLYTGFSPEAFFLQINQHCFYKMLDQPELILVRNSSIGGSELFNLVYYTMCRNFHRDWERA